MKKRKDDNKNKIIGTRQFEQERGEGHEREERDREEQERESIENENQMFVTV